MEQQILRRNFIHIHLLFARKKPMKTMPMKTMIFNAIKNAAKKIHSFEFRPNILIADAAPAITNGFKAAFDYENDEEFYRVTCWIIGQIVSAIVHGFLRITIVII